MKQIALVVLLAGISVGVRAQTDARSAVTISAAVGASLDVYNESRTQAFATRGNSVELPVALLDLQVQLPERLFAAIGARVPLKSNAGTEQGFENLNGTEYPAEREDVARSFYQFELHLGFALTPRLQPFALLERSLFVAHRSNFFAGNEITPLSATGAPAEDMTVLSTNAGVGLRSQWELGETSSLHWQIAAMLPITVFENNTGEYAEEGVGAIGQGTTGYSIRASAQYCTAITKRVSVTLAAEYFLRHWAGNGASVTGAHEDDVTKWPSNNLHLITLSVGLQARL